MTGTTPIAVTAGVTTTGIDFALRAGGLISGTVTGGSTLTAIEDIQVDVYDSVGNRVTWDRTDASGSYTSRAGLPSGTYYVRTSWNSQGYINELYDDLPCSTCEVTDGTAISVTLETTTSGIDFALELGGSISGTITDASDASPLQNVNVDIYDTSGFYVTNGWSDSSGAYTSDAGLPPGSYYARTWNSLGYVNRLYDQIPCLSCSILDGTPIPVTGGSTTSGIDFALSEGGTVSGTVEDSATGLGIDDSRVDLYDATGTFVVSGWADVSGAYTTAAIPPGTYYALTSNWAGYLEQLYDGIDCSTGCTVNSGDAILVATGSATPGIDFALQLGGKISGRVTDSSTGSGIQDVAVDIYDASGFYVTNGWTDVNGDYESSSGLPAGTYYARTWNTSAYFDELYDDLPCEPSCAPTSGTGITVAIGATVAGVDFELVPGGRISGVLMDASSGLGIGDAWVDVYDTNGWWVSSGYPDGSGNYVTSNPLTTGSYYARTQNSAGYFNVLYDGLDCATGCVATSGSAISVIAGSTTAGVDFALSQGASIAGFVLDGTGARIWSTVRVYDTGGNDVGSSFTNSDGSYRTAGLAAGTYFLGTSTWWGYGFVDELYDDLPCPNGSCDETGGTPVAVSAGESVTGIEFVLATSGSITGAVTASADGAGIDDASVSVYDDAGAWVGSGSADASGAYTVGGLPPGAYYALTSNWAGYVDQLYDGFDCPGGRCDRTAGTTISVSAGAGTAGIDFALDVGGLVAGTVTESGTGLPIPNARIDIYDVLGEWVSSGFSDGSGAYVGQAGLPTGTYYLAVEASGYVGELYANLDCAGGSCEVTTGTAVSVTEGATTSGIDFALRPTMIFEDGFESGSWDAWSAKQP